MQRSGIARNRSVPLGNMTTIPKPKSLANSYAGVYDAWNRLVNLDSGSIASYAYDGLHRRIKRTEGSSTRHFYYNESWQCLEERATESGGYVRQYAWHPHYVDALAFWHDADGFGNDGIRYCLHDALFSVTTLLNPNRVVVRRYAYDAYGKAAILNASFSYSGSDGYYNEHLYTGRRTDPGTGLQLNRNRYYHQQLGRWVNRDPIGYAAGDMNLYGYVLGQPTYWVDPTGESPGMEDPLDDFCKDAPDSIACQKLKEAKEEADDALEDAGWSDAKPYGGYCHYWSAQFNDCKCMNPPYRDPCIGYPQTKTIPLEDSILPWEGDGNFRTNWTDHSVNVVKNKCTGKCLIFDDGFWGSSNGTDLSGGVYDPCEIGRPAMVTGFSGVKAWNSIRNPSPI